jgi:hypothetical protein
MNPKEKARIEEIRARAEKATPGPWLENDFGREEFLANAQGNGDFCRAARTDIPYLLDLVERLEAERFNLKTAYDGASELRDHFERESKRQARMIERARETMKNSANLMDEGSAILEEYAPGHRILINGLSVEADNVRYTLADLDRMERGE